MNKNNQLTHVFTNNILAKKILKLFITFSLVFSITNISTMKEAKAEMSPKLRAFMVLSAYGTTGGALLGLASMAFGEDSIAIARGASLGLYAGMLFGGYVILSHKYGRKGDEELPAPGEYQDPVTPYEEEGEPEPSGYDGFFSSPQRAMEFQERSYQMRDRNFDVFKGQKGRSNRPPVYFNLVNLRF